MRRIVTYERVSSDDQRERATILTQYEELKRRIAVEPDVTVVERYVDDGLTGMIELKDRPAGARLLADARERKFDEVWVYKLDRLGRDDIDPLVVRRDLEKVGVKVVSIRENIESPLTYGLMVLLAAEERRTFLRRSRDGMERAAREGRYCGGIVPLGYVVEGKKQTARLAPDEVPFWNEMSPAELVRYVFRLVGEQRMSCTQVADHLNALKVPTAYAKDGRLVGNEAKGKRKQATAGVWRPSRIRGILMLTAYRGEYQYGKWPPKKDGVRPKREIISAPCARLVTDDLWHAAQETLRSKRLWRPEDQRRKYWLKSLVVCAICGLNYSGAPSQGIPYYRCNGRVTYRGKILGKCPGRGFKEATVVSVLRDDIERFLRDPGAVLDELATELGPEPQQAVDETERLLLEALVSDAARRRANAIRLATEGIILPEDLKLQLDDIDRERVCAQQRLSELQGAFTSEPERAPLPADLLDELRKRLDAGLTDDQWREIFGLLIRRITVHTDDVPGVPSVRFVVEYNFPANCVLPGDTDRD